MFQFPNKRVHGSDFSIHVLTFDILQTRAVSLSLMRSNKPKWGAGRSGRRCDSVSSCTRPTPLRCSITPPAAPSLPQVTVWVGCGIAAPFTGGVRRQVITQNQKHRKFDLSISRPPSSLSLFGFTFPLRCALQASLAAAPLINMGISAVDVVSNVAQGNNAKAAVGVVAMVAGVIPGGACGHRFSWFH